jgi:hypothetical protein
METSTLNWDSIIADAVARLDWVSAQTADADEQSRLLPMAGDGGPVELIPAPASVRAERRQAITRERMARLLGQRKGNRWAGREAGAPAGTFNPATITAEQAAGLLVVVRGYVRRWAGPFNRHPLSPEGQDDAVSRIIETIWTRDYSRSNVTAGNLAGATWQACALYRKTAWIGPDALARRDAKRARGGRGRNAAPVAEIAEWTPARSCDNPARIAAAVESAARGIAAPSGIGGKNRRQARRDRGNKRMPAVDAGTARLCLTGYGE